MKLAIGVDTGGTYTDAVLYDYRNQTILGKAKALTTKEDLCLGISRALDGLPADLFDKVCLVALSTTLATNACVEDKGGSAKLVFFGGDRVNLQKYGAQYGLPSVDEILVMDCKTSLGGTIENPPDWNAFEKAMDSHLQNLDGVGIIELYAMKNNAAIEREAKARIQKKSDVPVTCGYELFQELNSLQRGAGTLLNARLYPVVRTFMQAVRKAMQKRNIQAPVVVMRSDGSLMREDFALRHPIETLLCGPAASVVGGYSLTKEPNSIVVDMGGTTTDIAIIANGVPVRTTDGVHIGKWRTFVNGMLIRTFGLGGDSAVHYRGNNLVLEPYRQVPLCVAADTYPSLLPKLRKLYESGLHRHTKFRFEAYLPVKDIQASNRYTAQEKDFCRALQAGPLLLDEAAAAMGEDIYTFTVSRLVQEGVVQVCGLTPTDLMHVKGDFTRYSCEAAQLGAAMVADNLGVSVRELCDLVYAEVQHKMYVNIVKIMLAHQDAYYAKNGFGKDAEHAIEESYRVATGQAGSRLVTAPFRTDFALVGIGAPIRLFLPRVAQLLGTRSVVTENAEVANALGAVTGNVYAKVSVEIAPDEISSTKGFTVFGVRENRHFETLDEAVVFAEEQGKAQATAEVRSRGAVGNIELQTHVHRRTAEGRAPIGTETRQLLVCVAVTVEAVGNLDLPGVSD